jgi:hypothetical protein
MTTPTTVSDALAIYLNDHLAGATGGVELAHRVADSHRTSAHGDTLRRLAKEIGEDREALLRIMAKLDVKVDHIKVASGWVGEKLGRLKLNGHLFTRSPLSSVIELEALRLGVQGKSAGWRTLRAVAEVDTRVDAAEIDRLIERADRQADDIEELRMQAAATVFVSGAARSDQ